MDLLKMLILIDMLSDIADEDPETFKEAVAEAGKENDTDIGCEIEKLKKERAEKLKEFDEKLKELHEIKSDIKTIGLILDRLEKLNSKINK